MKKLIAILIMLAFIATAVPMVSSDGESEAPYGYQTDLFAGKDMDVGDVNVWNDAEYIYVEYITTGDWYLLETHVDVVGDPDDFPMTKKGNPIPGHFEYKMYFDPTTNDQDYIQMMPLGDLVDGDEVYIAAHAVVFNDHEDYWVTGTLDPVISDTSNMWVSKDFLSSGDAVLAIPHPLWLSDIDYETYFDSCGAQWIWNIPDETEATSYWFYKDFEIPGLYPVGDGITGTIDITCDNAYELWVNSENFSDDNWRTVETYGIGDYLQCGWNTFWVDATNTGGSAGLIYNAEDIEYTVVDYKETAWANGDPFHLEKNDKSKVKGDGNWGMYFMYTIGEGVLDFASTKLCEKHPDTWEILGYHGLVNFARIDGDDYFHVYAEDLTPGTWYYAEIVDKDGGGWNVLNSQDPGYLASPRFFAQADLDGKIDFDFYWEVNDYDDLEVNIKNVEWLPLVEDATHGDGSEWDYIGNGWTYVYYCENTLP